MFATSLIQRKSCPINHVPSQQNRVVIDVHPSNLIYPNTLALANPFRQRPFLSYRLSCTACRRSTQSPAVKLPPFAFTTLSLREGAPQRMNRGVAAYPLFCSILSNKVEDVV